MQRKHTSDEIRRSVFRDLRNGASIQELHIKYGINKKTLQSLKEERQDVGRPLKQYLIKKVLPMLPSENNWKKLLREMIQSPDKEFKQILNDYNSMRKKKLLSTNRKIKDGIAKLIVQIAKVSLACFTMNQESSVSTLHDSTYQYSDNVNYQNDESLTVLIQGRQIDQRTIDDFVDQVLFERSLPQWSSCLLNNSQDIFNDIEDDERNIQQPDDYWDSEQTAIESSSETVRRSRRNQQIEPSKIIVLVEVKQEIIKLRDSGVPKNVIQEAFDIPRQSLKDLKPEREDKYKGIEDYFVNYLKFYHSELIAQIGPREKKQMFKILNGLIQDPDEIFQKLILDYKVSWGDEDILARRRKARIMKSLERLSQSEINSIETESLQEESQLTKSELISKNQDHEQDYQSYYPTRKQIKLIIIGSNGINQVQYHSDQSEQACLEPEVYYQYDDESEPQFGQQFQNQNQIYSINFNDVDEQLYEQFDGESEPQFGQQFQIQTQFNSINFNDVDEQYHSNQSYQTLSQME
ncbi:hypothetical protein pb186bvf_009303 [Paramecium bursaria]